MNKLICIVGPTGTGKTAKAIEISKNQPSIIVSADSKQVYRGMDIVTGKDHPKDAIIYGVDIVNPDEPCSVAVWYDVVMPHIKQAWVEKMVPVVVGGTGLYVKALTEGIETMQVPTDQALREELSTLSIPELQDKLKSLNILKFENMNHSDSLNPRRLIRAIEIAQSGSSSSESRICNLEHLESNIIGLKYSDESIYRNVIYKRVNSRLAQGAVQETQELLTKYGKDIQSMSAIGYKSIIRHIENKISKEEMIEEWVSGELAYAKRQMTWFRKQPVIWYDVD